MGQNKTDISSEIELNQLIVVYLPLLKHPEVKWILNLAYNLTRLLGNNRTILTSVERASKVVFALKNYARHDRNGEKQLVQITNGIETVLEIYHNQIKRDIEVVRHYQSLPEIWCYPDELIQVWTNLIHNGIQAIKDKGKIEIATDKKTVLSSKLPILVAVFLQKCNPKFLNRFLLLNPWEKEAVWVYISLTRLSISIREISKSQANLGKLNLVFGYQLTINH